MTLRSHLYVLVLGALAPLLVLAIATDVFLVYQQRQTMREDATGRVRSMMSAIDAAVIGSEGALRTLAASKSLEGGDLRAFHEESRRFLATQPQLANVSLASVEGENLTEAILPFGARSRVYADLPNFYLTANEAVTTYGNVTVGPAIQTPAVRIRVPVLHQGQARYVISAPHRLEWFEGLLKAQGLPQDWVIGLIDHNRRFIARIPAVPVGSEISTSFRATLEASPNGWFSGRTLEGVPNYSPYITSARTGWTLSFAIPQRAVNGPAWRALGAVAAGTAVALALAVLLVLTISRRIEEPISRLAEAAGRMRRGEAADVPRSSAIAQISALAAVLHQASAAIREREELLRREKAALEQADRAKDEFIAMLSHELRNPLAALMSAAEILKQARPDNVVVIKARGVLIRQTRHMARLIDDLLDVSGIATGQVALTREPVNLADAAQAAVSALRASATASEHLVSVRLEPAWVEADRARLEQIVGNLLDNAAKYTPRGKQIKIATRREGNDAVLEVADEGEGIPKEELERIFDLLVQVARGLDRRKGGLGVGLAVVKRLVEMHGGSVSAKSEGVDRGSTFTVRLPAVQPPAAAAATSDRPRRASGPRRILIVEDNEDVRETLREQLSLAGHQVMEARDGAQALEIAASVRPEVMLIDLGLPDIDGFEVARRLRAASGNRGVTLIAITGYGQPQDRERTLQAGFDAHLVKPVTAEQLKSTLDAIA